MSSAATTRWQPPEYWPGVSPAQPPPPPPPPLASPLLPYAHQSLFALYSWPIGAGAGGGAGGAGASVGGSAGSGAGSTAGAFAMPGVAYAGTVTPAMGSAINPPATAIFVILLRIDHSLHEVADSRYCHLTIA